MVVPKREIYGTTKILHLKKEAKLMSIDQDSENLNLFFDGFFDKTGSGTYSQSLRFRNASRPLHAPDQLLVTSTAFVFLPC